MSLSFSGGKCIQKNIAERQANNNKRPNIYLLLVVVYKCMLACKEKKKEPPKAGRSKLKPKWGINTLHSFIMDSSRTDSEVSHI